MSDDKNISINKGVFTLIVLGFIALLVAAFFVTKCSCDGMHQQLDTIQKWGITIALKEDKQTTDYQVNHEENNDEIQIFAEGKYGLPKPGETRTIDFADISGITDRKLSLDSKGSFNFAHDSFIVDHVFHCPLVFNLGFDKNGKPLHIDGNDYVGKRVELENDINKLIDKADMDNIPQGTDVEKACDDRFLLFSVTYPDNQEHKYENIKNAYYEVFLNFTIKAD